VPVFTDVSVSIPGMPQSKIVVPAEISETNVINPSLFLENVDTTFAGSEVTPFSSLYTGRTSFSYL
jgi:hypothetical protein